MSQEDLSEMLRRVGRSRASITCLSLNGISRIATGVVQARVTTCEALAKELGLTTPEVVRACDESWRRAHAADATTPASPAADDRGAEAAMAEVHAGDDRQAVAS